MSCANRRARLLASVCVSAVRLSVEHCKKCFAIFGNHNEILYLRALTYDNEDAVCRRFAPTKRYSNSLQATIFVVIVRCRRPSRSTRRRPATWSPTMAQRRESPTRPTRRCRRRHNRCRHHRRLGCCRKLVSTSPIRRIAASHAIRAFVDLQVGHPPTKTTFYGRRR